MSDKMNTANTTSSSGAYAPTFEGMLKIVQASNYTLTSADLEFKDNAIDAGAKEVWTHVHSENGYTTRTVTIDSGGSMDQEETRAAWQMAGNSKTRADGAIGKFGVGMNGAFYSTCKDATLISNKNGVRTCIHTDVDIQHQRNQFDPTEFKADVNREYLDRKAHPSDVDRLLSLSSGTLVQARHLLPEMVAHVDQTVADLKKAIAEAYPHLSDVKFYIQKDDGPVEEILRKDYFYHNQPSAVRFSYATKVHFYRASKPSDPPRVIEEVIDTREYSEGRSGRYAYTGNFYEHKPAEKRMKFTKGMTLLSADEVNKLNAEKRLIGTANIRMIQVTDDTYNVEQKENPTMNHKGIHLLRVKRKVSGALTFGNTFNDRETHNHRPRQRMEVEFTPSLDSLFGVPFSKMVRDGPLAQKVVGDTLYRIFRQRGDGWTKIVEQEDRAPEPSPFTTPESSDTEESNADIPMPPVPRTFLSIVQPVSSPTVTRPASAVTTPVHSPVVLPPLPVASSPVPSPLSSPPASPVHTEPVVDPDVQWVRDNEARLKNPAARAEILKLLGL